LHLAVAKLNPCPKPIGRYRIIEVIEAGALISIKAPGQPRRPLAFGHLTGSGKPYVASVNPENARTMTTPSSLNNVITIDD
jgi:hypothetical protein